uniref:Large ribosomal subunit protein eL33 n=1 Tax=Ditylenchus dipsaci TaxID=166011 RepID=A0A915EJU2_9BILA
MTSVDSTAPIENDNLKRQAGPKAAGRLYVKAIFTGYKRGQRNQHENTALLTLDGVFNKDHADFYVGKRAVYVYKGHKKTGREDAKTRVRTIWGESLECMAILELFVLSSQTIFHPRQ